MVTDYSQMDHWSAEEVDDFKELAISTQLNRIEINSGVVKYLNTSKTIVAEGDSWFDYTPGTDLIDCLRYYHGYYIDNSAKFGDTLENMIYGVGVDEDFNRTAPSINKVLRKIGTIQPLVFLFSGGGNDIVGDEFGSFLNHQESGLENLRFEYADHLVNVVFKKYFEDLIEKVQFVSKDTHIVVHGYGYTVPTGKGVGIFSIDFAGPWLLPALSRKGIFHPPTQLDIVCALLDKYNEMLAVIDSNHEKFHHVDLRNKIDSSEDWTNELHLKNSAYAKVADEINNIIRRLR